LRRCAEEKNLRCFASKTLWRSNEFVINAYGSWSRRGAQIRRQTTRVHAGVAIRPELDPRPYESAVSC
jgi:hypothetical protein